MVPTKALPWSIQQPVAVIAGRKFSQEFIQSLWSLFLAVTLTPVCGRCSRNTFFVLFFPSQEAAVAMAGRGHFEQSTHLAETSSPSCQPASIDQHKPIPRESHQAVPSHSSGPRRAWQGAAVVGMCCVPAHPLLLWPQRRCEAAGAP